MMIRTAENFGWIKGMSCGRTGGDSVTVSHILYADDTLLLCEADRTHFLYLRFIFSLVMASKARRTPPNKKIGGGHGANIKFWTDLWVGDACWKDKFPTLFNCSTKRNGNVAHFLSNSGWQQEFRRNLNDWEVEDCQLLQQNRIRIRLAGKDKKFLR
ncbi:hypothetical protein MTR67_047029 [Solanum verrucosum]|uniref:Uncharacterized protein n=1 Tax=Solanum verrucosum TaxID=315347 RepID=A0AAF0ZYK6_SOLVR|nr:hypothetical protein MTR67_047029 [Solanum verrucosum]